MNRERRREEAIKHRIKRQKKKEHELSLLPPSQLQRWKRRQKKLRPRLPSTVRLHVTRKLYGSLIKLADWHGDRVEVLLLSHGSDYASLTATLAECLRSVGVNAVAVTRRHFHLKSASELPPIYDPVAIKEMAETADVLIWMHSLIYPMLAQISQNKKCVVFHGGTRYRRSHVAINARFNDKVDLSLVQTGELLGRGAKNEHWFLPPVNTDFIKPDFSFEQDDKLVIGHFSSHLGKSLRIKGSIRINAVIESLRQSELNKHFTFRTHGTQLLPWGENLARIAKCDIYIESLSQASTGKDRHDWSITALEACALGCVTITNFAHEKRYLEEYGKHSLIVANTSDELKAALIRLLHMDRKELLVLKHQARQWAVKMHSYKVVGKRLKAILGV